MDDVQNLGGADFSPEFNMVRYLQKIRQYPILAQDEEYNLAVQYQQTRSPEIAKILETGKNNSIIKTLIKTLILSLSIS